MRRPAALQVLALLDEALIMAQGELHKHQPDRQMLIVKENVHARLAGLALHQDGLAREACPAAGDVGAAHIGRLVTVAGGYEGVRGGAPGAGL